MVQAIFNQSFWQVGLTMAEVHRDVLRWDYFSVTDGGAMRAGLAEAGRVPTRFQDLKQYTSVFRTLLLEELRAHLQQVVLIALMTGNR